MIANFRPVAARIYLLSAGTAVLAAAGIVWSVLALAGHYDEEFMQVAREQSATVTVHAHAPTQGQAAPRAVTTSRG